MGEVRAGYPELFELCRQTAACFIHTIDPRGTFEVTEEERFAFWENRYAGQGFGIWQGNFRDMLTDRKANRLMSDFVADKIRQRVEDPMVAEKLIPNDHGFGTRRVPQETHYYEVYNQPNVELVSMLEEPIERITRTGIRTSLKDYDFDVIICGEVVSVEPGNQLPGETIAGTEGLVRREATAHFRAGID